MSFDTLLKLAKRLSKEGAPAGRIRQLLDHLIEDQGQAKSDLKRIEVLLDNAKVSEALGLTMIKEYLEGTDSSLSIPHYDALTLLETKTY